MVHRLRSAPKAPLAVAGILATPLFFVALMAMSLAVEKPSVNHIVRNGKSVTILGDPSGTTELTIWLLALLPAAGLVLLGTVAMYLGRRGVILTSLGAVVLTVGLLVSLPGWTARHTARYPIGVDLIPRSAGSEDIYLRGEWEGTARHTAEQLGIATIAIAGAAIAIVILLEVRRRRGIVPPPPPPPPEIAGALPRASRAGWRR
jgi:hypothetical protein